MTDRQLMSMAKEASLNAYIPYSHFAVGAAVLTKDGKVFVGANIENSSYPLCMCAERNALYHAMLNGYKKDDLAALALIAETDEPCSPCGACRQVISELLPFDAPIYMAALNGKEKATTVKDLIPFAFSKKDLQ